MQTLPSPTVSRSRSTCNSQLMIDSSVGDIAIGTLLVILVLAGCQALANGEEQRQQVILTDHVVSAAAFSPDGKLLATGGEGGELFLWTLPHMKQKRLSLWTGSDAVCFLQFFPDGQKLLAEGLPTSFGHIAILDLADVREELSVPRADGGLEVLHHATISPDGRTLAVLGTEGIGEKRRALCKYLSTKTGDWVGVHHNIAPEGCNMHSLGYSPDGKALASAGIEYAKREWIVAVWDARTGEQRHVLRFARRHSFRGVVLHAANIGFSPDGKLLASSYMSRTVKIWKFPQMEPVVELDAGPIFSFSPDSRTVATTDTAADQIQIWSAYSGKRVGRGALKCPLPHTIAFSPDGRTLVVAGRSKGYPDPTREPIGGQGQEERLGIIEVLSVAHLRAVGATDQPSSSGRPAQSEATYVQRSRPVR